MPKCVINILHKLGLYKRDEIDGILKWATEVSCAADKVIEEANSHSHAVDVLRAHCDKHQYCTECVFYDNKYNECDLAHIPPCYW